jgi:hypothetical protein
MTSRKRKIASWILLLAAAISTAANQPAAPQTRVTNSTVALQLGNYNIRKLHLVRPDLIPYPISYDVIC